MGNTQTSTPPTAEYFRERPKCLWCNKKLRQFGPSRFDWSTRKYHNTCHRLYVEYLLWQRELESMKHEAIYEETMRREHERLAVLKSFKD